MKTLTTFGSSNLKCKEQRSCEIFHFKENFGLKNAMLTLWWNMEARHRNFLMPLFPGNESCDLSFAVDWFNESFNECFLSLTVLRPQCLYAMLCREPIYKQRFIGSKRPKWNISRFLKVLRFLCLPFPYKIGQEIVATTACTDPPKIVWSSHTKVKILNCFNNLVRPMSDTYHMKTVPWYFQHTCQIVYNLIYYALTAKEYHIWVVNISKEHITCQ